MVQWDRPCAHRGDQVVEAGEATGAAVVSPGMCEHLTPKALCGTEGHGVSQMGG